MLTINDLEQIKNELEAHTKRRIQLETEEKLIKKDMKEKFGIDTVDDAGVLIEELQVEAGKIKNTIETKKEKLIESMKKDGLL
jgi:hypothetical protein